MPNRLMFYKCISSEISLKESIDALENDHKFLLAGEVFTEDFIQTWIDYKRTKEIDPVRLRPHPWEYHLYFDV